MNFIQAIQFLEECVGLYNDLQKSGLVDEIKAEVQKGVEIEQKLMADQRFKSLFDNFLKDMQPHK